MPAIPDTSVKWIDNTMRGAPVLNGVAGSLIGLLDAFLLTGWGLTEAISVTVADGIATATLTPGQTFFKHAVVLVAGATPAALNGEARVLSSTNSSITWATSAPDGVATGTITIKYAPQASWIKQHSDTNKAAYKSTHPHAHGVSFLVSDAGSNFASITGFEEMPDIDSGIGPFPSPSQVPTGGYFIKSTVANASPVRYSIYSDERFVICSICANAATFSAPARGFGDCIALSPAGDAWGSVVAMSVSGPGNAQYARLDGGGVGAVTNGAIYAARPFAGVGSNVMVNPRPESGTSNGTSGADVFFGIAPSEVDGQIKLARVLLVDGDANKPPRLAVPGIRFIPQTGVLNICSPGDFLEGAGELAGRWLRAEGTGNSGYTLTGVYLVDVTGPWR